MAELRQCCVCGRAGVRGFVSGPGGGSYCAASLSCWRRRRRETARMQRWTRKALGR